LVRSTLEFIRVRQSRDISLDFWVTGLYANNLFRTFLAKLTVML